MKHKISKIKTLLNLCFIFGFLFLQSFGQAEEPVTHKALPLQKEQKPAKAPVVATQTEKQPLLQDTKGLPFKEGMTSKAGTTSKAGKALGNTILYHLNVDYGAVNFTGSFREAMFINGQIPAPTLYFKEGQKAIIYVTNKMDVETSIHWHGILLPNFQDGVSYLTTPPITPGKTHKFEFTLRQSGTYWYHSHTGLQEQSGLYGAIVVKPKNQLYQYDHELVLVLSDWTDEDPHEVLRTLKRGSEWYALKKGSALSLWEILKHRVFKAQWSLWGQRMPGMDISDVYYSAFLINGHREKIYPDFKAGEKIRLRIINASASTYFWLSFGGQPPLLISADGIDVKPFHVDKLLQTVAETYDFLITVPQDKALEVRATAQDGTGFAQAFIGQGEVLKAPKIRRPNPVEEIRHMARMHAGGHNAHGGHDKHVGHGAKGVHELKKPEEQNHTMDHSAHSKDKELKEQHTQKPEKEHHHMGHTQRKPNAVEKSVLTTLTTDQKPAENNTSHHANKPGESKAPHHANKPGENKDTTRTSDTAIQTFGYDSLKALKTTAFSNPHLKEIHLNLTGNMLRYVWSFNGRTLSQSDKIPIKKGETLRLHLHNHTMMHHPMHLHGHFFRVLNGAGEKAPLKHTVDVPPMQTVVIEFNPEEKGDWFFHCHILYHMKSGMSRVFSHGEQRDPRLTDYPISKVFNVDRAWFSVGEMGVMSNRADLTIELFNIKNKIELEGVFSWVDHHYNVRGNFEVEGSYEYFVTDFFQFYGALSAESFYTPTVTSSYKGHVHSQGVEMYHHLLHFNSIDTALNMEVGFKYLLPYFIELIFNIDNQLRPSIGLEYELLLFPWTEFFAEWEWTMDFGLVNRLSSSRKMINEFEWEVGLQYILSKNFSLIGSYSNHFSYGLGLTWQF